MLSSVYKMASPKLDTVLCIVVHCCAKREGMVAHVEFKPIFDILQKYLSDGDNAQSFFHELMSMITTVSYAEWGGLKDPSQQLSDNTILSYIRRGLTKAMARRIVYRLTPDNLADLINERDDAVREAMAEDLRGYIPDVEADTVGDDIALVLAENIQLAAGMIPQDKLAKQREQTIKAELKSKYGDFLLSETGNFCPFPGCGRELVISGNGQAIPTYEVNLIEKDKPMTSGNLIALCPQCSATYTIDNQKKTVTALKKAKQALMSHRESVRLLNDKPLERGIIGVVGGLKKLGDKDLRDASLDPKQIKQKILPSESIVLYNTVNNLVTIYYIRTRDILMNLDKKHEIDYDEIQSQMKSIYLKLKKAEKTKEEIFGEIVEKIHRMTLQERIYCQIVVCFFIQKCEVYDAIAE